MDWQRKIRSSYSSCTSLRIQIKRYADQRSIHTFDVTEDKMTVCWHTLPQWLPRHRLYWSADEDIRIPVCSGYLESACGSWWQNGSGGVCAIDRPKPATGKFQPSVAVPRSVLPDIRYEGEGHILDKGKTEGSGKLEGCGKNTRYMCVKCKKLLRHKCFTAFHIPV